MLSAELRLSDLGSVPCGGCTRCCRGDAVRLLPADDPDAYQTEPHPSAAGELMLAHKPNGDCVYLGEGGCTIHEHAPQMCRQMDCRVIARNLNYTQARKTPGLPMGVWRRGKELLRDSATARGLTAATSVNFTTDG